MTRMTVAALRTTLARGGALAALALAALGPTQASAGGCRVDDFGTLPVELVGGRATTMVKINGRDTRFIMDTGAFFNTMSRANASGLGLTLQMAPQGFYISGVGGDAGASLAQVKDFGILGANLHNILFVVGGSDTGMGLLGANLLLIGDLDLDLAQGKAKLLKPNLSCQKVSMAYWAPDGNYNEATLLPHEGDRDRKARLTVMVNGKPVKALLDTGAPTTVISHKAAERSGIDLSPGATKPEGETGGIGKRRYNSVIARVSLYQVGTESIQNSRMSVIDGAIDDGPDPIEMLIGLDFIMAHHIFIANSQRKLYFSYNGGRVSTYDKKSELSKASTPVTASTTDLDGKSQPDTPQAFALRGSARLAAGDAAGARADLDKAIALAPDKPESADIYYARARARLVPETQGGHIPATAFEGALSDLDLSLKLAPDRPDVLLLRARLRMGHHERAKALEDIATLRRVVPPGGSQVRPVAGLLIETDQPGEALPLIDGWLRLHPDDSENTEMLNMRCWARGLANTQLEDAAQDCRKAVKRSNGDPGFLDSQGLVELRLGHWQAAYDIYAQALAKQPDMAWSRYGQALAMLHLGQAEAGKAQLAAVTASNPGVVAQAKRLGLTPP
jgi:predicted aspartyl protease